MDARFARSREKLHAAVLTRAAEHPLPELSVAEICRAAGVTRETFYKHAPSVAELLAEALGVDLERRMSEVSPASPVGEAERSLLTHLAARAEIYRGAMNPLLVAPVRDRLEQFLAAGLDRRLDVHPDLAPAPLRGDPLATRMAVAFAASGTVGAIEEWLRAGGDDIDRGVEIVLAASPQWWLGADAER